ncbi:MAG: glucose-1-phosphate thymidylyltransferase [Muribaculaceae bacterium]|nr:glucose-1-phosphate thymidylyltransferase [Muribaculaceae bacterium]
MPFRIYLFDSVQSHGNLLPLSFTRPVADFRIGITTIRQKWEDFLPGSYSYLPVDYLREKFGCPPPENEIALFINGSLLPDEYTAELISNMNEGDAITDDGEVMAFYGPYGDLLASRWNTVPLENNIRRIRYVFDIFLRNPEEICNDFFRLTSGRESCELSRSNRVIGDFTDSAGRPLLFIEEGASVEGATLNLLDGPIYIGKDAEIMEGSCVRGPLALCSRAKIRMGSKIYGGSTFGPFCKVGGEIDNAVMFGYSNKAHDGYLGNAVIGEWCNIGAGVNASNLKNDYSKIRVWNYYLHTFMRTDLQFCGPIIGDHTKLGVNCMLNTATVLGVGVNLHGAGFPRVFVPSFSEGSPAGGFSNVPMKKFNDIASRVMGRRELYFDEVDKRIFEKVYEIASGFKG